MRLLPWLLVAFLIETPTAQGAEPVYVHVEGAHLVAMWREDGERIRYAHEQPQTFLVRLQCTEESKPQTVRIWVGKQSRQYNIECASEAYLAWESEPDSTLYRKTLIRR